MSSESKPGFSVFVTVQVAPENAAKFLEAFKPAFEKMIANPECEFFELYRNPAEPGVFSWMEDWSVPFEWMVEEHKKDYFKDYMAAVEPILIKPHEARMLERVDPGFSFVKKSAFRD